MTCRFFSAAVCGFLCAVLLFVADARGQDDAVGVLVDCGAVKVVTFPKTMSKDGLFAVGWTLLPAHRSSKPIDWSQWSERNESRFFETYPWDRLEVDNPPYVMAQMAVDLKRRICVQVDEGRMVPPHVAWNEREADGHRYGLVGRTGRRGARRLILVVADKQGLRMVDLLDTAGYAMNAWLHKEVHGVRFTGLYFTPDAIDGNLARIGFNAENSYNYDDEVDGTLTLRLPDGVVQGVERKPAD